MEKMENILDEKDIKERLNLINLIKQNKFNYCKNTLAMDYQSQGIHEFSTNKNCEGCPAYSDMMCNIIYLKIPISISDKTHKFFYDSSINKNKL